MQQEEMIHRIKFKELILSVIIALAVLAIANVMSEDKADSNENTEALTTPMGEDFVPLSVGRVEGATYINEYFGIQCTLNDSWEFENAAGLLELYNKKLDGGNKDPLYLRRFDDESVNKVVKEYKRVPLMISYGQNKFVSCYVYFDPQNPGSWQEEEWEKYMEKHASVAQYRLSLTDFAGESVYCLSNSYELNGKTCYEKSVFWAQDYYICDITALSFVSEADAQAMLNCFAACESQ